MNNIGETRKLRALLVGINEYNHPDIPDLKGCVNDVMLFQRFILQHYQYLNPSIEILLNHDATRSNIIKHFRHHLSQNNCEDVILFYFSGHGSREKSAPEFNDFVSGYWSETLVCYDSRKPFGLDLSDKEIAVLISEVAVNNPHFAIIFDCCHSGSGIRSGNTKESNGIRKILQNDHPRPIEQYLDGWYVKKVKETKQMFIPESRCILLSACDRNEQACETTDHSGIFTTLLMNILCINPEISYADLFLQCRREVIKCSLHQTPQFEAYQYFNPYSKFLDGTSIKINDDYQVFFEKSKWKIDCGIIKGLPEEYGSQAVFALYPIDTENFSDRDVLGYAQPVIVGPEKSEVKLFNLRDQSLQNQIDLRFKAIPRYFPSDEVPVFFSATEQNILRFVQMIPQNMRLRACNEKEGCLYEIQFEGDMIKLIDLHQDKEILTAKGNFSSSAGLIFSCLSKIRKWERAYKMSNIKTRLLDKYFEIGIYENDANNYYALTDEYSHITISVNPGNMVRLSFNVKHSFPKTLYFILLYLSDNYGIYSLINEPVDKGELPVTLWGQGLNDYFYLPEGKTETEDIFKIIVSTEKMDDFLFTQEGIEIGKTINVKEKDLRDIQFFKKLINKTFQEDWTAKTIQLKLKNY